MYVYVKTDKTMLETSVPGELRRRQVRLPNVYTRATNVYRRTT